MSRLHISAVRSLTAVISQKEPSMASTGATSKNGQPLRSFFRQRKGGSKSFSPIVCGRSQFSAGSDHFCFVPCLSRYTYFAPQIHDFENVRVNAALAHKKQTQLYPRIALGAHFACCIPLPKKEHVTVRVLPFYDTILRQVVPKISNAPAAIHDGVRVSRPSYIPEYVYS